jgi:hypothetical protein
MNKGDTVIATRRTRRGCSESFIDKGTRGVVVDPPGQVPKTALVRWGGKSLGCHPIGDLEVMLPKHTSPASET